MKFSGEIGFVDSVMGTGERAGIWEDVPVERHYYGDILQNYRRWDKGEDILDDLTFSNKFSVLADNYIMKNQFKMKYIIWNGARLKITNVELQWPRILISVGGLYNGPTYSPQ